jgi:ankyrin repeat protein
MMIWELLIRRGVQPDWHDTSHDSPLHHLAEWDGTAETAEFFASHGGDPDLPRGDGKTPYFLAVRAGNTAVADVLRAHGAKPVRPADHLIGACRRADPKAATLIVRANPRVLSTLIPEDYDVLVESAAHNRLDIVKLMLEIGFSPGAMGGSGATPLHSAAWHGQLEMVRLFLAFGAPKDARDAMFGNTPREWAIHGSKHCRDADEDYAAIVTML